MNLAEHFLQNYFCQDKDEEQKKELNHDYDELGCWTTREKRLNHIFFTNGNGLEWIDGVLVNSYEMKQAGIESPRKWIESLKGRNEDRRAPMSIYPVCEYSRFCCIPDDVEQSFLDLAWETYNLATATPFTWVWERYAKEYISFHKPGSTNYNHQMMDKFSKHSTAMGYLDCVGHELRKRFKLGYWDGKYRQGLADMYGIDYNEKHKDPLYNYRKHHLPNIVPPPVLTEEEQEQKRKRDEIANEILNDILKKEDDYCRRESEAIKENEEYLKSLDKS